MEKIALPLSLVRKWVQNLLESLSEIHQENKKRAILERCGQICFQWHRYGEKVLNWKKRGKNLSEILQEMNVRKMWCGEWLQKRNAFHSICEKCECPLILSEMVRLTPIHCYCSLGFVKNLFEIIVDKPVQVELKKTIGRGDKVCHFIVHWEERDFSVK